MMSPVQHARRRLKRVDYEEPSALKALRVA
jgi:hypothetical protein